MSFYICKYSQIWKILLTGPVLPALCHTNLGRSLAWPPGLRALLLSVPVRLGLMFSALFCSASCLSEWEPSKDCYPAGVCVVWMQEVSRRDLLFIQCLCFFSSPHWGESRTMWYRCYSFPLPSGQVLLASCPSARGNILWVSRYSRSCAQISVHSGVGKHRVFYSQAILNCLVLVEPPVFPSLYHLLDRISLPQTKLCLQDEATLDISPEDRWAQRALSKAGCTNTP